MRVDILRRQLLAAGFAFPIAALADESNAFPVTINDDLGPHTFSQPPQRVVALQWDLLENMVGIGVTPVGAADISSWDTWVGWPKLPTGIVDVGTRAEPNLELIARLKPDLILIGATQKDLLPTFSKIAPTLYFENYRADAPKNEAITAIDQFYTIARVLNREVAAHQLIDDIFAGIGDLGHRIKRAFGFMPALQVVRFSSLTTLFVYTPNSIADFVLQRMGIQQPLVMPNASYGLTQVRIRDLKNLTNAYVVYVRPFSMEKKLLASILWQATPFARKGHVAAASAYWSHGGAPSLWATAHCVGEALLSLAPKEKQS